jgi:hypothetical protein
MEEHTCQENIQTILAVTDNEVTKCDLIKFSLNYITLKPLSALPGSELSLPIKVD